MADPSPDLLAEYQAIERDGGAWSVERDVVRVEGPDAGRYLQGQLSQDVVAMPGRSAWSLVLQPTGKVDAWVRVRRESDEAYVLDVDPGAGEALVARLRRFLLRTKAEVTDPRRLVFHAERGPTATVVVDAAVAEADGPDPLEAGGPAVGPGVAGADWVAREGATYGRALQGPARVAGSAASYERYRIAHAVPAMGRELTADTIPAEAGQWLIDASVSFTKGCYTGQELVARIDSRGGNVPRPVRLLVVDGGSMPSVGGVVHVGDKEVGAVTSATPHLGPGQPALALAPLSRSVEVGAEVEVATETGSAVATVVDAPFVGDGAG